MSDYIDEKLKDINLMLLFKKDVVLEKELSHLKSIDNNGRKYYFIYDYINIEEKATFIIRNNKVHFLTKILDDDFYDISKNIKNCKICYFEDITNKENEVKIILKNSFIDKIK